MEFFRPGLLIILITIISCSAKKDSVISKISREEYDELMNSDYQSFDQTPDGGWRKYNEDVDLQIQLIQDYIKLNHAEEQSLRWHLGQLYGMNNNYDKAIEYFEQCIYTEPGDNVYRVAWNYYVNGTIAFMKRDKDALNLYADSLRNHDENMNIEVLERLQKNFDKTYKEAY